MKIRGLLYDLARSQRAKLDHLQRVVDGLAECGLNMMVINLEHRFEFPSCPGIAPRGALSVEMARTLVAYGKERGVAVVPQPNLIGHCEGIGATERYGHLSCDPHQQQPWGGYEQLNLDLPEARDLAAKMLADVCDAFPGDYLHIGCDEVRRMECLFPGEPDRQLDGMLRFFDIVLGLARKTGRQIMMWGDVPLHHAKLWESLPRDVIVCDWHYGPNGSRETLQRYKSGGFRVLASPSVATYSTFAVDTDLTFANITKMVGDARELDLEGFLLTTWEPGFDLVWPWVELAGRIARGEAETDWQKHLAGFAAQRYGVDGEAVVRWHDLLQRHLADTVRTTEFKSGDALVKLRKTLFRGASPFPTIARPKRYPANDVHPNFSRTGRYIAYNSDVSGRSQVHVMPVADLTKP
jgi:hypothetical protein